MKKNICAFLALCLIIQIFAVPVSAGETITHNYDSESKDIYEKAISEMLGADNPDAPATREFAAYQIARRLNLSPNADFMNYNGKSADLVLDLSLATYKGAIMYAVENKIIGITDGYFNPFGTLIYQDAVTAVLRSLGYSSLLYPWGYIEKAEEMGITTSSHLSGIGYGDNITKKQFCQVIYEVFPSPDLPVAKFSTKKSGTLSFEIGSTAESIVCIYWENYGYTIVTLKTEETVTVNGGEDFKYYTAEVKSPKEFKGGNVSIYAVAEKLAVFKIPNQNVTSMSLNHMIGLKIFDCSNNQITEFYPPESVGVMYQFSVGGNVASNYPALAVNVNFDENGVVPRDEYESITAQMKSLKGSLFESEDFNKAGYDMAKLSLNLTLKKMLPANVGKAITDVFQKFFSENVTGATKADAYYKSELSKSVAGVETPLAKDFFTVDYTITLDESQKGYAEYYAVTGNETNQKLVKCSYDKARNAITFNAVCNGTIAVFCLKEAVGAEDSYYAHDVPSSHWAYEYIKSLVTSGIVYEIEKGAFRPEAVMTRGTFITSLAAMGAIKKEDAVSWAADNKILLGYGNGDYGLDDSLTREQMAVLFYRYFVSTGKDIPENKDEPAKFADDAKISLWAAEAVALMRFTEIIKGKPNNIFDPQGTFTRAEACAVLWRIMNAN